MIQVKKFTPWNLLQPGYTTIWPFLFYSDYPAEGLDLDHEKIHAKQQLCWLLIPYFLLYLFGPLPVFFNPFRFRWEYHAYKEGSMLTDYEIKEILSSSYYGWLPYWLHSWVLYLPPRRK